MEWPEQILTECQPKEQIHINIIVFYVELESKEFS